ncbi:Tyrosine recombinase XerC [Methylobacterium symbioticum]|uniref:Tyrosine recombinase XerC n=1 Tax=Methylobacterium symbioticum TaxID=2584084 RepID=A0A509EAD1_9HYPH|nr:Tyrosine recombinase XerC [Methylobacterium symbioticum]
MRARRGRSRGLTFDDAVERYWIEVSHACASPRKELNDLARLATAIGPTTPLAAINDDFVAQLVLKRRQDFVKGDPRRGRISPAQVNRSTTQLLRRILTRARVAWKQTLPEEPNWRAHMLAEPKGRVRELRYDEEGRLGAAERDDYRAPRLFAQLTGLRRREIAGLTWDQVDFGAETISVVGKGDKPHVLPITDELRALLEPLRAHHPAAVFTYVAQRSRKVPKSGHRVVRGQRYPITYEGLGTQLGRTFAKAGLKDFRIHDLRHTAATRTLRATGNLRIVQQLLNHASPTMTARYAHADLTDLREAMAAAASDTARRLEAAGVQGGPSATP